MAKREITDLKSLWESVAYANGWQRPTDKRPPVYSVIGGGVFQSKGNIMVSTYHDGGNDAQGNPQQGNYNGYKAISTAKVEGLSFTKTPCHALPINFELSVDGKRIKVQWGIDFVETFNGKGGRDLTPTVVKRFLIGEGDQPNKTIDWTDEELWMALEMSPFCKESPVHWSPERKKETGIAVTLVGDMKTPVFSCLHHADAKAEKARREVSIARSQANEIIANIKAEGPHVFYKFCDGLGLEAPEGANKIWELYDMALKLADTPEGRKQIVSQALMGSHDADGLFEQAVDHDVVLYDEEIGAWRFNVDAASPIAGAEGRDGLLKAMKADPFTHYRVSFYTKNMERIQQSVSHTDDPEVQRLLVTIQELKAKGEIIEDKAKRWVNKSGVMFVWGGNAKSLERRERVLDEYYIKMAREKGAAHAFQHLADRVGPAVVK